MTSDKQIRANRKNALKSTGPKTPEGKDVVRLNAVKHGLLSEEILLPNENKAAFEELSERLREELQPVGEVESLLVDRIIAARWRLNRLGRVEAGIFAYQRPSGHFSQFTASTETTALGLSFIKDANGANAISKLSRYETTIERSLYRALHELQLLQAARRDKDSVPPPVVVDVDVSGVSQEDL